jgi:hypothetical protein
MYEAFGTYMYHWDLKGFNFDAVRAYGQSVSVVAEESPV